MDDRESGRPFSVDLFCHPVYNSFIFVLNRSFLDSNTDVISAIFSRYFTFSSLKMIFQFNLGQIRPVLVL